MGLRCCGRRSDVGEPDKEPPAKQTAAEAKPRATEIKPGYQIKMPDSYTLTFFEKAGQGGFGSVYRSQLKDPAGAVKGWFAAKVLNIKEFEKKPSFERERVKVKREATILSRIFHSGVVNMHYLMIEDRRWVVMVLDWMKGGTLYGQMQKQGYGFSESSTRYICIQIANTLKYLHSAGIVHRDIKLDNILIDKEIKPTYFKVKLGDFGLSNVMEPLWGKLGSKVGTVQYLSPEMINTKLTGTKYGVETDVWSFGVTLYVMISQHYPFGAEDATLAGKVDFREGVWAGISQECCTMIEGMLRPDPDERWTIDDVFESDWLAQYEEDEDAPSWPTTEEMERVTPVQTNLLDISTIGDDWKPRVAQTRTQE